MQRLASRHGIPQEIVDIWTREEGPTLLPIQAEAIEKFHLLESQSLLITAPSSSGKTFVAELAAISSYYRGKKTVYLVPMKSIAEEKYADFVRKYRDFGLQIAVSTHDRTEFDNAILTGSFDIAIVIFEKMNILLTENSAMMNSCGLVVVDELQLLNDKSRGSELEILLTKIKLISSAASQGLQFLGLSAVLANLNQFDTWVNASHCKSGTRPLELHEGVLSLDGTLKIRNHNDGIEYSEGVPAVSSVKVPQVVFGTRAETSQMEESILQRLVLLCKYYLGLNKRILIFRKWRPLTRNTAQRLARELGLPQATEAIRSLSEVERTNSREALIQCLAGGVAFHNSDLSPEERLAIEADFRNPDGRVQIVCSTSTLAMGVNMPTSVVIISDTVKPNPDSERFHEIPITASEYKNMAGRAGRTRFREDGISILMANSPAEATRHWRHYVNGSLDTLSPPLRNNDLRKIMLSLFAGGLCQNGEEVKNFLLSSYTGYVFWNSSASSSQSFVEVVDKNVEYLQHVGLLVEESGEALHASPLGRLCATSGVEVETFVLLQEALERIDPSSYDFWEVIFPCLHSRELSSPIRIYLRVVNGAEVLSRLEDMGPRNRDSLLEWSYERLKNPDDVAKRVQAFLVLTDWINGIEMRDIEDSYTQPGRDRVLSGTVRNIAETTSWMVRTFCQVAETLEYDTQFTGDLETLCDRLTHGVPAQGIEICKLSIRGATRSVITRLVEAGYGSLDQILDTPAEQFAGIISPQVAGRIREAIVQRMEETQEKAKRSQVCRLEKLGRNTGVIEAIYEKDGVDLEHAIVNLLNAPPLELGAERIGTQRHGEPDIRLTLGEGLLVGSVTASSSNISNAKCVEIISGGSRMNPTAYVVFGRPGFHELAVETADHMKSQLDPGKSYKLIPIHELGELFVLVAEGHVTRDAVIDVLMNHRGLIGAERIGARSGESREHTNDYGGACDCPH